ncbi:MAG: WecB/TagA/CpsF family glycosyltransferase [Cyanobacteria bacterium P01_H01_bin.74]
MSQSYTKSGTFETADLFGYPVFIQSSESALQYTLTNSQAGNNTHVVTMNPEMIMQGLKNSLLHQAILSASVIIPDGTGVVWALKRKRIAVKRLPGIEFATALLKQAEKNNAGVAIIGAQSEVLTAAIKQLCKQFENLNVVFYHHGYYSEEEEASIVSNCANAKPKLVLIALGVPRQELWIARYKSFFQGATLMGIGGSLDVWSGSIQRAPLLFRQLNLEWLYRITTEPWRLKRVYKTLPLFALKVLLS